MSNSYDVSYESSTWTWQENKMFEIGLVLFPKDTDNRWEKIAESLPGKSAMEVEQHYQKLFFDIQDIESGNIELPKYKDIEVVNSLEHKTPKSVASGSSSCSKGKKKVASKAPRPWSDEENRLFAEGLKKHRPGAWTLISRQFVKSRTPNQCASHYQKYEERKKKNDKNKKRPSNFDNLIVDEIQVVQRTTQDLVQPSSYGVVQQQNAASTHEFTIDGSFNEDEFCEYLESFLNGTN